jgi:hypothetical protein
MTPAHVRCKTLIIEIVATVNAAKSTSKKAVQDEQSKLNLLTDVKPRTATELLADELFIYTAGLEAAQDSLAATSSLGILKRLWARNSARQALLEAEQKLREAEVRAHTPLAVKARQNAVNRQAEEKDRFSKAKHALTDATKSLAALEKTWEGLALALMPLTDAVERNAWLGVDAVGDVDLIARYAREGRWESALKAVERVTYQRLPTEALISEWKAANEMKVAAIETKRAGFSAMAPFRGLIKPTLELAATAFSASVWEGAMARFDALSDQWHALPRLLSDPTNVLRQIQWIFYWAFLTESQQFAEDLTQAKANEDILTGDLSGVIRKQLRDWAKPRLEALGYPKASARLDMVRTAGQKGEAMTGADIGIIVNLEVGDLQVHKVALLQAKLSANGSANIGSKASERDHLTQLQKLNVPDRDFYMFYHQSVTGSPSMLPTVTPVSLMVNTHKLDAAALARENVTVRTRDYGWDLASFVAFGLCDPAGQIGRRVAPGADPLEALKEGGRTSLPQYVVFVSLADDEHSYAHVLTLLNQAKQRSHSEDSPELGRKDRGFELDF